MVLLKASFDQAGRRGSTEHADYLIDRFRVHYQFGGGWTCGCADFAATDACRHTREAAGRLAAQKRIIEHIAEGSLDPVRDKRRHVARERTPPRASSVPTCPITATAPRTLPATVSPALKSGPKSASESASSGVTAQP